MSHTNRRQQTHKSLAPKPDTRLQAQSVFPGTACWRPEWRISIISFGVDISALNKQ